MTSDFKKNERKWQEYWKDKAIYEPNLSQSRKPFYNLMMFPYPSAEGLHIGNMYAFTGSDILGRFKRMQGYDVFEPIGLDGFGIHSENYALKINAHPMRQAKISEKRFYKQLQAIGNGFAWKEKLETYDPAYYKWTQWIFTQLFKKGLAYRKKQAVNWCPSCKTVLADEQVINGRCERCSAEVIKRELEQWFFRITKYAERLLKNLEKIDWSERVKIAQRNWIGQSEGAVIKFKISAYGRSPEGRQNSKFKIDDIEVFTTRPDTLFGATYMVLAPEHEIIKNLESRIKNLEEVRKYIKKSLSKSNEERIVEGRDKTGIELKGIKAINPATKEPIPIFVADYVLASYGTGAIMAVPAHDERDWEFAKKYKLPIVQVIEPCFVQTSEPGAVRKELPFVERNAITAIVKHWSEDKYLGLKWKKVDWGTFITGGIEKGQTAKEAATAEIIEETGYLHPELVKKLSRTHSKFFHVPKNENRFAHFEVLYFRLKDGAQKEISSEEKEKHEIKWLSRNELGNFLTAEGHKFNLEELISGQILYAGEGILINSGKFNGLDSEKAKWEITKFVHGKKQTQYRLRDWLISRQRYWGPPIPMIYCERCAVAGKGEQKEMPGWYAVPEKDLPVKLPFVKDFQPRGKGESPLASVKSFYEVKCPTCGVKARRETDVSDTFLDSAWYFLRYPSTRAARSGQVPWDAAVTKKWLPVNMYIGGAEHSVLHLLYSRFLTMVFKDWGLLDFEEPFTTFRAHGLLIKEGGKMSKSKGNVVNPDEYIKKFGADALRMALMFFGPFEEGGDFGDSAMVGVVRFLERVQTLIQKSKGKIQNDPLRHSFSEASNSKFKNDKLEQLLHKTIKKVTEDIENLRYNTAISALMVLANEMEKGVSKETYQIFLKLLAPFAPHLAEELNYNLNSKLYSKNSNHSIHLEKWPTYNPELIEKESFDLVIQVNGKMRGKVLAKSGITKEEAEKLALEDNKVKVLVGDNKIEKIIFVPDRLINIVVKS